MRGNRARNAYRQLQAFKCLLKHFRKRWVFRHNLKAASDSDVWKFMGRYFHEPDAKTEKCLDAYSDRWWDQSSSAGGMDSVGCDMCTVYING